MRLLRAATVPAVATVGVVLAAGPAAADHCVNADTNDQGLQVVIDTATGEPSYLSPGVQRRIDKGLIDVTTGEGFHGPTGLDFDGDGAADAVTFQVTPWNALPGPALVNNASCHGIVDIYTYLFTCLSA
jgi:hypothetical protein